MSEPDQRWINVGNVRLLPVLDATVDYPWPLAELFPGVPDDAWEPFRARYPDTFGGPTVWRSSYRCFLLRSQGHTILLDTGMGPAGSPLAGVFGTSGQLIAGLEAAGIAREEVDFVVLSHLHPDHVGGNFRAGGELTFPNARHLVPAADWDAFHRPEVQEHFPFPYVEQALSPLESLGVLELITGEHDVTGELRLLPAPGHTPGHTNLLVASEGDEALLVVDALLHPAQVTEPDWSSMFDMDPEQDRMTRHRLLDRLEAQELLFAASHFPEPAFGRITRVDGRRYWEPMADQTRTTFTAE
jgi:glyoxylase-like metal-dependent hydrolase (beta-lactamase superfamily II)